VHSAASALQPILTELRVYMCYTRSKVLAFFQVDQTFGILRNLIAESSCQHCPRELYTTTASNGVPSIAEISTILLESGNGVSLRGLDYAMHRCDGELRYCRAVVARRRWWHGRLALWNVGDLNRGCCVQLQVRSCIWCGLMLTLTGGVFESHVLAHLQLLHSSGCA
jgi:hypothetical protein